MFSLFSFFLCRLFQILAYVRRYIPFPQISQNLVVKGLPAAHNVIGTCILKPGVLHFLERYGYLSTDADEAIIHLKERLSNLEGEGFPHEIGIFLGYPLGDVIGFIENAGRNFKCSGCWKVYCNECEAVKLFAKYKKCRDVYLRLWQQGRSVLQLTVAA